MPDNYALLALVGTRPALVGFDETFLELVFNKVNQGCGAGLD